MRLLFATMVLVTLGLAPGASLAEGNRREGARLFRQGEGHYDDDEFEEALVSFQASLAAFSHPATQFNIALCLEKLGRLREADEVLAQVEQGNRRRLARKARYARTRIAAAVPTLRVNPGSDGASVVVDGEACPAPCERRVDPGAHEVVVADAGSEHRETVQLSAGQTFQLSLERFGPSPATDDPTTVASPDEETSSYPALVWGGAILATVGVAGMLYFGLSEDPSTAGAVTSLGLAVVGIGIGTTGLLLEGDGERTAPPRAGLSVRGEF